MSTLTNLRWAREQRTGDRTAKSVLFVIVSHSDRSGTAMLAGRTIAAEAEVDEATVRKHAVPILVRAGLVEFIPGRGRGKSRYRLLVDDRPVRASGPAQRKTRSADIDPAQQDLYSADSKPRTTDASEDDRDDRSAESAARSAESQPRDQHEQPHEVEAEVTTRGGSAAPPRVRGGGRADAPTRAHEARGEIVPAAELDATAGPPAGASGILAAWAAGRRLLASQRRELRQGLDALLRQGADPALLPAALDEAHDNPRWRDPVRSLGFAYREVERAATRARSPTNGSPAGGIDARIDEFLRPTSQTAIGGAT